MYHDHSSAERRGNPSMRLKPRTIQKSRISARSTSTSRVLMRSSDGLRSRPTPKGTFTYCDLCRAKRNLQAYSRTPSLVRVCRASLPPSATHIFTQLYVRSPRSANGSKVERVHLCRIPPHLICALGASRSRIIFKYILREGGVKRTVRELSNQSHTFNSVVKVQCKCATFSRVRLNTGPLCENN